MTDNIASWLIAFLPPLTNDRISYRMKNTSRRHHSVLFASRNCIGQVFAMHQTRVVLYHLLRTYEVYYDDVPEDIPLTFGVTLQPTNGLHVKFRPIDENSY